MKQRNLYPVFVALIVALGGFLLGFDGVVNGGAVPFYRVSFGISDQPLLIGLSSSAIIFGAILGNFLVAFLIDKIGRKPSLLITSVLFMIGAAGTSLADTIEMFIFFKLIAGVGVGVAILCAPLYIAEIAPPKQRGWLVTFNQLNIVIGLSIAMLSNYYILNTVLDPEMNWRWMLGVGFLPAVVYFILLFFVPESPRWLIQNGQEKEGLKILKKSCGEGAQEEFDCIKSTLDHSTEKASFRDLFRPEMYFVLIIGLGLGLFQQLSGINAVLYYAPMIFESAGSQMDTAFLMAIVVGVVFTISTVISMFLIDRLGRRPLLIIGVSIIIVSFASVTIAFYGATYEVNDDGIASLVAQVEQVDISNQAKIKYPSDYFSDSTVTNGNVIHLFQSGRLIGKLDRNDIAFRQSEVDIAIITDVLKQKSGLKFNSETDFFSEIKSSIVSLYDNDKEKYASQRFAEVYKPSLLKSSITINNMMVLLGILGFIVGFSISLGPVMWAMFSEIFPTHLKAKAISLAGAVNGVTSFTVATVFPLELDYLGSANTYLIYEIAMIICLIFIIKVVPETKGKSLEELEKELIRKR
ncbi:MAG: sugar porter family MFS transporter [Reichenbachiella sp.]